MLYTWVWPRFKVTPYIQVSSPLEESGKTALMEMLELFVMRPLFAGGLTAAVMYRAVHEIKPVLFLDETDALFAQKEMAEAVRLVLNNGYAAGHPILRMEGGGFAKPKSAVGQDVDENPIGLGHGIR